MSFPTLPVGLRIPLWNALLASLLVLPLAATSLEQTHAQGRISSFELRPFVTAIIPVVGRNGAVGGVLVDAKGALTRAKVDELGRLQAARQKALRELGADIARPSRFRKISLKRLEAVLREHVKTAERSDKRLTLPDDVLFLAGLLHVEFVFVYPDERDIILAGPAEGWRVDATGAAVGQLTGKPTLLLADLVTGLRIAEPTLETGIRCSIDPTTEGLSRLQQMMESGDFHVSSPDSREGLTRRAEAALGNQRVTIAGAPRDSHFAHVLVAADFMMKRLAMGLEPAPVEGLPSYLDLLKDNTDGAPPRNSTPRWWMTPDFPVLLKDSEGLAWRLPVTSVKAMTEAGFLSDEGKIVAGGRAHPLAQAWADRFTAQYNELASHWSVFGQLQNCINLAVVGMLIHRERLTRLAEFDSPHLMGDEKYSVRGMHTPRSVESRATLFRMGPAWMLAASGGVDIDAYAGVENSTQHDGLEAVRRRGAPPIAKKSWWWD